MTLDKAPPNEHLMEAVGRFTSVQWDWRLDAWPRIREAIGLGPVLQQVQGRETYPFLDGVRASAYFHDDQVDFVEATLSVFTDVEELDDVEYDDKVDEYYDLFRSAVATVTEKLGKPVFADGAAARGFPDDQDAVWLALWNLENARLMIQQKHEDRDMPFRLSVVVAPPSRE